MSEDLIAKIGIDEAGRLCVSPASEEFPFIYRAAMEVGWSEDGKFLYSPEPREWSYLQWYRQIIDAAKSEYGCVLSISPQTLWSNVDESLKANISRAVESSGT